MSQGSTQTGDQVLNQPQSLHFQRLRLERGDDGGVARLGAEERVGTGFPAGPQVACPELYQRDPRIRRERMGCVLAMGEEHLLEKIGSSQIEFRVKKIFKTSIWGGKSLFYLILKLKNDFKA